MSKMEFEEEFKAYSAKDFVDFLYDTAGKANEEKVTYDEL